MSKHILFLTNWYPTKENPSFGIFVKRHSQALSRNYNVTVVHLLFEKGSGLIRFSYFKSDFNENTYILRISGFLFKFFYYIPNVVSWFLFKKLDKSFKFDLIFSNVLFNSGLIGYHLSKKLKLSQVHIEHWSGIENFIRRNILGKKGIRTLEQAETIFVVSRQLETTIKNFIPTAKILVVPNVISNFFSYRENFKDHNFINFIAVANWKYPKRIDLVLGGLKEFQNQNSHCKVNLKLIGKGPSLNEELIQKLNFNIERIEVVDNAELPDFYSQADFLLHFSDFETFSIVPLEALACGCPVIVSRVGVLPDFIDDSNGRIVENNVESIAVAIAECVAQKFSRKEISENIKNVFSMERISKQFQMALQFDKS
jgi:glycosyltransferase involved in cell wall biosynthesis